jgi:hypothetical protein
MQRRRAAYDAALVERDILSKELAADYEPIAQQLADLAGRIAANDAVIERVNRKLPDGSKWIDSAELIARVAVIGMVQSWHFSTVRCDA